MTATTETPGCEQLRLDEHAYTRLTDPATCRQVPDSATRARHKRTLLLALAEQPDGSAICETLALVVGNLPNRVARRLGDLRADGLVEVTDEVRTASTGRSQQVHRLLPAGQARVAQLTREAS